VTHEAAGDQVITHEGPPPLGDLLGKTCGPTYRIVRLIGCGGMAAVWLAESDDVPGQFVAVKVLLLEHTTRRDLVDRHFGEARAASALDDPNVVKVLGTGRLDDRRPILIMEFIDGASVHAMVDAQGPLPIDTIGQLMIQTASALRAAHAKDIIHRDIKPSNLLVYRRSGREFFLKVCDFGIAKMRDPQLAGNIRTRTKSFIGTPGFIAPEQALGKPIDVTADIYALGVVLYYLLTGRLPHQGDSELETLHLQVTGAPFPAPIELRPETPPEWNELVLDCLQLDPTRRPAAVRFAQRIASGLSNGAALLEALAPNIAVHRGPSAVFAATLSGDVPTALSQLSAQRARPRASARERSVRIAIGAAGMVLGCLVTFLALRFTSPAAPVVTAEADAAAVAPLHGSGTGATDAGPPDAAQLTVRAADAGSPDAAPTAVRVPDAGAPPRVAKPPDPGATKVTPAAKGRVVISVTPFADVYIDGRPSGTSPLDLSLPAGAHTVRLVNQPRGRDETIRITVDPSKPVILEKSW
jgi:eukaryotic-like serine/threonine-protein kinase